MVEEYSFNHSERGKMQPITNILFKNYIEQSQSTHVNGKLIVDNTLNLSQASALKNQLNITISCDNSF